MLMKLKRKTAQLFVDLYKKTNFVLKVKNPSVKEESQKVDSMLNYCNEKNIPLLATPTQLSLLNDYMQNGNSYINPRSKSEIFRAKMYLLNMESIIENSMTQFINKPSFTKKRSQLVEETIIQLNEVKKVRYSGINAALTDVITEKVKVKKRGREYYILKPREDLGIKQTIEKTRALLDLRIASFESELSNIINLNRATLVEDTSDSSYLAEELINVKKELINLNTVASSIDGIIMENSEGIKVVKSDIEAFCEANNAMNSGSVNMLNKLNKKITAVISTMLIGFIIMTAGYFVSEKFGLLNDPPAVVDFIEDPDVTIPQKEATTNYAIAQYIILHERFDAVNFNEYTLDDINGDYEHLHKEAERKITEMDKAEIIALVNDYITNKREGTSLVEFYDGVGYTSESSDARVKDGDNLTISFTLNNNFEYDGQINQLQIINGTAASILATIEGDKIIYTLNDLQVEKDGQAVIFSIGDLAEKEVLGELSLSINESNNYGVFNDIPDLSEVNIEDGLTFNFKPHDQYNNTTPVFNVHETALDNEKNEDGSFTYKIPYDILKKGGEVNVVDATEWQLNNYNVSYTEGDGWKFETMPSLVPHGRNVYIFVSVKPEYKGIPVLYVNGVEVKGDASGEYGLIKFKISTTEDIEITGSDLEPIINIETRSNGNVGQTSTNDSDSPSEVDNGGTSINRG